MWRVLLLRLGAYYHGRASLGHAGLVPSRDVLNNVLASGAPRTKALQLLAIQPTPWRSRIHGRRRPKLRPLGLEMAPLPFSTRRRRLHNITRRAVRRAGTWQSAFTNGWFGNHAASDHSAKLSWLCLATAWSAIADWRVEQALVNTRSSGLTHKGCGVSNNILHVAFCTNARIFASVAEVTPCCGVALGTTNLGHSAKASCRPCVKSSSTGI